MSGEITGVDVHELAELSGKCEDVHVNSNGGSVESALMMGRIMRNGHMRITVEAGDYCASACVFLFVGAVSRAQLGTVQIHRPYLTDTSLSLVKTKQRYKELEAKILGFLEEMGLDDRLYREMMMVPPHEILSLSPEDFEALGVGPQDPVYAEYLDNRKAAVNGLTKVRWLELKGDAESRCGRLGLKPPLPGSSGREVSECWRQTFPQFFTRVR